MQVAQSHRSSRRGSRRRLALGLAAGVAASTVAAIPFAVPAMADPGEPLGPTLIKTDAPPSGYAVKFRYQAPEGVNQVHIYGDWWFAQPPNPVPNHPPSEWQPGDFAATDWRLMPMELGEDGVWEITVPLPAGSYRYAFTHDCTNELATGCPLHYDPANPWEIFPQYPGAPGAVRSTFFVPTHPDFPTYDNDYQRPLPPEEMGTLESVRYPAPESTNPPGVHDMLVYTPKGYDPNRPTPYPTLYISHGGGDHSTAWFMQGVAHYIVQNAINEGVVQDMVVVATDFNGLPGGNNGYANHLRNTVIPYIEAHYNVSTRPEDRAFGGFSAGASRAFTIMFDHTDLFGYHAAWSAGAAVPNEAQIERLKTVPGGIMFGTGRYDGGTAQSMQTRAAALRAAGVDVVEFYMDGMHTWHVWRPQLNFYIRNIAFRTTTTDLAVEATRAGNSHNVRITATATVDTVSTSATAPSGTVEFYAGDTLLGTAEVKTDGPAAGTATLRGAFHQDLLTEPIVAKYLGNDVLNGSDSAPVTATF